MCLNMFFVFVYLAVFMSRITAQSTDGLNFACPFGCLCYNCSKPAGPERYSVNCTRKNNSDFRDVTTSRKFCYLDLSRNEIRDLQQVTFHNRSDVIQLSLSFNLIKEIRRSNFTQRLVSLKHLYLDHNKIDLIERKGFQGLKSLVFLNLDHNRIRTLTADVFAGLSSLTYLSVAHNKLKFWKGTLVSHIPNLHQLHLEGNVEYTLTKKLMRKTSAVLIHGATISKKCQMCNLSRVNITRQRLLPRNCKYLPVKYLPLVDEYLSKYILFTGPCKDKTCELPLTSTSKLIKNYKDRCWEMVRDIRPLEYSLGSLAIALNLIILVTVLSTKSFLRKASFLQITHLAFCDLLIGLYCILVATGHELTDDAVFRSWRRTHCPYYRSLLVLGQTMGVVTSLVMTAERYFAIVYCMRPTLNVTPKLSVTCFLVSWPLVIGACVILQYFDNAIIIDNFMCVLVQNFNEAQSQFLFSQALMLLLVFSYLFQVGMYVHIYLYVRKSALSAGIRRESKLAKRIGLIVFSNLIFFVIPNVAIVAFTAGMLKVSSDSVANSITRVWLPPMCMVINSCLNPFLFAFRNDQFIGILRRCCERAKRAVFRDGRPATPATVSNAFSISTLVHGTSQLTLTEFVDKHDSFESTRL